MNKPDWKDAPDWAMWLGLDSDGAGYWFSHEPELLDGWEWTTDGVTPDRKCEHAGEFDDSGCPYLEPRP
jgi:hypothetical protein